MVTRILTVVTLLIALGLAYYLVSDTYEVLDKEAEIQRVEQRVIQKLGLVREAQEGYQKLNGKYASTWDSLKSFIEAGEFPVVEVKETIFTLDYGADSVVITRDTLDFVPVIDSLFTEEELTVLDLQNLGFVHNPRAENSVSPLILRTEMIERGNYFVPVIEVVDEKPFDRRRKDDNERRTRRPLRFGSLTEISTAGNWE